MGYLSRRYGYGYGRFYGGYCGPYDCGPYYPQPYYNGDWGYGRYGHWNYL